MKQAKVLTQSEFKRLIAVIESGRYAARNRLAVMLSFYAGLRVGEIAALSVSDVVQNDGNVREQLLLRAHQTKGGTQRVIFLNRALQREIRLYATSLQGLRAQDRPLLVTQKGRAFSANVLCQLFGELYRKAGIDGASSHSGRRSFITTLAHNGISPKVIMELAGHKNLATTQRYIDVTDEMKRQAVEFAIRP
jgi:integrase/recombinase XerD